MAIASALSLGYAGGATAAGLGRLTVQSALGQPLRAEVEITSLTREEAASLSAKLASPDQFRQAGLEFNPALGSLRFSIDRRPDGRAFVRISSSQPINEPFVDLLVELNWASGKFVREYTFLLDPPELRIGRESVEGNTVSVVTPSASTPPAQRAAPAAPAQPAASAQPAAPSPAAQAPAPAAPAAAAPAPASRPAAAAAASPAGVPSTVEVASGDTLAAIAGRVKPADVSLEQALIAIYRANTSAFFGGVHQLRSNVTLSIPSASAMAAVTPADARRELRVHTENFNAYRDRLAGAARTVEPERAGQTAAGSVTAKVQEGAAPASGGDRLQLSRSEPKGAAGAATGSAGAAEGAVALQNALNEQTSRVRDLERNVADLQRLVELKNAQLAEMQKQLESAVASGKAATGAIAPPAAQAPAPTPAPVQAPKAEAPAAPAPAAEAPKAEAPAEAAKAEGQPPAQAEPAAAPPVAAKPEAPKAAPKPAPAPEPGFVDSLLENPLTLPGLGAIAAGLGAYALYVMRRRRKEAASEDSLIAAEALSANSLFGTTGGQAVDTSNSLFASSARDGGLDVHSTEVDPLAEADVYIAYGREAQAEEILREALRRQPERHAIRAKLLEIYSGRKDAESFAAIAREMYDMTGGQNEEWPRVVTLGLALDPTNPLYTGAEPAAPAGGAGLAAPALAAAAAAAAGASVAPPVLEPAEPLAAQAEAATLAAATPTVLQQGFAETVPLDAAPADEIPALDFNLDVDSRLGLGAQAGLPDAAPSGQAASELERAIEGRFELPSLDLGMPAAAVEQPAPSARDDLMADLGDFKIDLPSLESLGTREPSEPAGVDLSAIGLDLMPADSSTGVADSARWQEMATKLDLASAYEEIGDKEGARELLEEVLKGGDSAQQQKAQEMLAKIG